MNDCRTAVSVAAAVFLCLALLFPSWAGASPNETPDHRFGQRAQAFAYTVQVGAFLEEANAQRAVAELRTKGHNPYVFKTRDTQSRVWQRVCIGHFTDKGYAKAVEKAFKEKESQDAYVLLKDSYIPAFPRRTGNDISGISEIKRASEVRSAQKRALAKRLTEFAAPQSKHAQKQEAAESQSIRGEVESRELKRLEQRVKELETAKTAQEDVTRSIIRDAVSTLGSNIKEFVALGGTLEVLGGWGEDFSGQSEGVVRLETVELDFEVQVNDWTLGSLVITFDDETNATLPTTSDSESGVDRITLDTASITLGDLQRFPPFATVGRVILPFGISTGDPVADVLTIVDPLTIEAFEMRETAIGFGLGFPTPVRTPALPPVISPRVKPLVINPLISTLSRRLGYDPPPTLAPTPNAITPTPAPPLFNVGIYSYNGNTFKGDDSGGYRPGDHLNATVGFRTQGNCGRPYDQLRGVGLCPWSIDVDVDYNGSIFDSRFLEEEYRSFLGQIGFVPGMAVSVKATLGPVSLVGEWNGAIEEATFVDDLGNSFSMRPSAWQLSLGYQFDWNPWVEAIGAQGNYLAIGYSESYDLAGVMRLINDEPTRVGFVPRRRFLLSVGEWVLDGVKYAIEYSYNVDYSTKEGGTGKSAHGVFTTFTLVW